MYEYGVDFIEEKEIERMIVEFLRRKKKKDMEKCGNEIEKEQGFEDEQEERQTKEYVSTD